MSAITLQSPINNISVPTAPQTENESKWYSDFLKKINFTWNRSKSDLSPASPNLSSENAPLLISSSQKKITVPIELINQESSSSSSSIRRITSALCRCFDHPLFIGGVALTSAATIVTSEVLLAPVLTDFTTTCLNQLNDIWASQLITCRDPYQSAINTFEGTMAGASFILGYTLQKLWGIAPETYRQANAQYSPAPIIRESRRQIVSRKLKDAIAYIQNHYSYEIHLGLGWFYNGLWVNTSTQSSWDFYYTCRATGIGVAACFLGMYLRLQRVYIKSFLNQQNEQISPPSFRLRDHWKSITISGMSVGVIILTSIPAVPLPLKMSEIAREISIMLLIKPIGQFVTYLIDRHRRKSKILTGIAIAINFQGPLVLAGYSIYLMHSKEANITKALGMGLVGIVTGIKDARYEPIQEPENRKSVQIAKHKNRCITITQKIGYFVKEYWRTAGIISFAIALSKFRFLDCYNISQLDCPISFELTGNYVNIDGNGVNIAIATGLSNYYVRKVFKLIKQKTTGYSQKISNGYLHLTDKYQFELLSLIPYATIQSGNYIADYKDFASYNPIAVLVLLGITLGTFKEQANSSVSSQSQPVFTDLSVATSILT